MTAKAQQMEPFRFHRRVEWIFIRNNTMGHDSQTSHNGKAKEPSDRHHHHNFIALLGILIVVITATIPQVEAAVSSNLGVGQAQTYCGLSQGSYPTAIPDTSGCSTASPLMYQAAAVAVNPIVGRLYILDTAAVMDAPLSQDGIGTVSVLAGAVATSSAAAQGTVVGGSLTSTRFTAARHILGDVFLHPGYFVADSALNHVVRMDMATQKSSLYAGQTNVVGTTTSSADFHNFDRLAAKLTSVTWCAFTTTYLFPAQADSMYQPKIAWASGMVTTLTSTAMFRSTAYYGGNVFYAAASSQLRAIDAVTGSDVGAATITVAPASSTMQLTADPLIKVLWVSTDGGNVVRYDFAATSMSSVVGVTGTTTSTGHGPMAASSYGLRAHGVARNGENLYVASSSSSSGGAVVRVRVEAAATVAPTLNYGEVEFMCGQTTRLYPTSMTSNQCSTTNPLVYYAYGSCVNHVAKRVYFAAMYSGSVYGYPIPNEGYGNLELMAGKNPCTSENDCLADKVGTFRATQLSNPSQVFSDPFLHPVYLVPDTITNYVYAFDVGTHMSTRYLGNGVAAEDQSEFNNVFRTSAAFKELFDLTSHRMDSIYLAVRMPYIPRVSLSTGMVTSVVRILSNGELYRGPLFSVVYLKGLLYFTQENTDCVGVVAVTSSETDFDVYQYCRG
eukprot:PhM_4_TR3004/c1_g2_i3/m.37606